MPAREIRDGDGVTATAGRAARASGVVHWVGTGLSTGRSGLGLLCRDARRVVLWDRTAERAAQRLDALGLGGRAEVRALTPGALEAAVGAGDVVVSMLPAAQHPRLLAVAAARGAHFACTSYTTPELAEQAARGAGQGLVVVTESGLDPGIDHLLAHRLVERARREVGEGPATARFTSYCGGVPAVPDEFRYRFSWAPYGVLAALRTPARYLDGGTERTAPRPWEAVRLLAVGGETFEVYPNRDSLPFVAQYDLPPAWRLSTFVRGTLRHEGWRAAWRDVFATVAGGDEGRIRDLADDLARAHPTTPADRDRVVLHVELTLAPEAAGGGGAEQVWRGGELLDVTGSAEESAMARCVGLPLAHAVTRVVDGALPPGLQRAAESPGEVAGWLEALRQHGLTTTSCAPAPARPDARGPDPGAA